MSRFVRTVQWRFNENSYFTKEKVSEYKTFNYVTSFVLKFNLFSCGHSGGPRENATTACQQNDADASGTRFAERNCRFHKLRKVVENRRPIIINTNYVKFLTDSWNLGFCKKASIWIGKKTCTICQISAGRSQIQYSRTYTKCVYSNGQKKPSRLLSINYISIRMYARQRTPGTIMRKRVHDIRVERLLSCQ